MSHGVALAECRRCRGRVSAGCRSGVCGLPKGSLRRDLHGSAYPGVAWTNMGVLGSAWPAVEYSGVNHGPG